VELFDPATGTWAATGALTTGREDPTATLLPNGKVLVAGGYNPSGYLSSAELYDPATGKWTATGTLTTGREDPTATLLPNGKVLVVGGRDNSLFLNLLASAELYDVGLGSSPSWQPQIATFTSPLISGGSLVITGSQFRGVSEGSGGNTQDSPGDYPVVQLRSVESGQTLFLLATNWQTNSFTSAPVWGFPAGWTLATVFVNGIPSSSILLLKNNVTASVTLSNLSLTYDGTAKSAMATTTPTNLTVALTYNGLANAPTNAGSYTVIGTIYDVDYIGGVTKTLVINQATASVTLSNLSQTYDGTAKSATAATAPTNLTVVLTYNGSANAPTNAGSYTVVGTVNAQNYQGSATNTLVIGKATATVTLGNLSQIYDGTAKSVTATTTPPGLTVNLTYNGSTNAPTNPGSYAVIATVDDPNYQGSAAGTLVIFVQLTAPACDGNGQFQFTFNTASGVDYTIQISTDLINWIPALTFRGSGGPLTIIDPNATSSGQRFYRLEIGP
jgi:hypothetical protein